MEIEVVDLFNIDLPGLAGDNIEAKYTLMVGKPADQSPRRRRPVTPLVEPRLRRENTSRAKATYTVLDQVAT